MVAQVILVHLVEVRILAGLPYCIGVLHMNSKDKILFFDDESSLRQYMLTGRVIPPEWRNGNLLLKKFNPWLYDPETALQYTVKEHHDSDKSEPSA